MFIRMIVILFEILSFSEISALCPKNCAHTPAFCCADEKQCISSKNFCDGVRDCNDGSDEIPFIDMVHNSGVEGIRCSTNRSQANMSENVVRHCFLQPPHICNHELDCDLGEDESNCDHTFHCLNVSRRLGFSHKQSLIRVQFCDGVPDCDDKSDEFKYSPGVPGYQCTVTKTRITSKCMLPMVHVCDRENDCDDGTDECRCNNDTIAAYSTGRCFRCLDKTLVVPQKKVCDGKFDCPDLTDECLCHVTSRPKLCEQLSKVGLEGPCEDGQIICRPENNTTSAVICVNRTSICDQYYDCPLREDEKNCSIDFTQIFNCSTGGTYIPLYQRCDNFKDCNDGSDEYDCQKLYQCTEYRNSSLADRKHAYDYVFPRYAEKCDNLPDCEDLDDECNSTACPNQTRPGYCDYVNGSAGFICPNSGSGLIGKEICDGFPTCSDTAPAKSADEFNCTNRFYCSDRGVNNLPIHIPLSAECDGIPDCYDWSDERNCSNKTHFYCRSKSVLFIPRRKVCNGIQDCPGGEDECQNCSDSPFSSDQFLIESYVLRASLWMIGVFALIGNFGVLIHSGKQLLCDGEKLKKIAYNHRILVVNLAMADFLMGIYLVSLGIVNEMYRDNYCKEDIKWRACMPCVILGSIVVISMECSVCLLAFMATHRLIFVLNPFINIRRRHVGLIALTAWVIAITLAIIPSSLYTTEYFLSSVWYRNNHFLTYVKRVDAEEFTNNLWSLEDPNNPIFHEKGANVCSNRSTTWTNMIYAISRLNANYTPERFYGYYSAHGVCLPRLFAHSSTDRSYGYSLFIVILNFMLFMWILVSYVWIYKKSNAGRKESGRLSDGKDPTTLQGKITRIVATNFFCWVPVCIMAFISMGGGYLSPESYTVSAIILLPINSAFNPFLYSDLPDWIWKYMKPVRERVVQTSCWVRYVAKPQKNTNEEMNPRKYCSPSPATQRMTLILDHAEEKITQVPKEELLTNEDKM